MGVFDIFNKRQIVQPGQAINSLLNRPLEMLLQFTGDNQVIWNSENNEEALRDGYLSNHAIFTIQDWKSQKVASAPPILYEVRDKREYKKYKALMKNATPKSLHSIHATKLKALVEVENEDIMKVFEQPNPYMSWFEFAYGHTVYKDMVGSSYWQGVRAGSVNDPTIGKIKELYLPPAHHMRIKSGERGNIIDKYFLNTNPDVFIDAKNVKQLRNFSPRYDTNTQWLYGLSRLHAAREILKKHSSGVTSEADLFEKKGIRDLVFLKNLPEGAEEPSYDQVVKTRDKWNQKINEAGPGGIILNSQEVGSIRIGFSPAELGILESQKLTKKDFCALYHVSDILFGWSDQTTFNNLAESRKISLTDAVLPELEAMADALNSWYLPSYDTSGKYVIGFDHQYFSELQDDFKDMVGWMEKAECLTVNERRELLKYGASTEENANKIIISGGKKLLENVGLESFPGDPDLIDEVEEEEKR